ncbi:hypothetical protein [Methylobacterium haplocladii]|uniref:Uncharacterized protein n=1 Tax=Methylobacterium haplocladii TaxID=1176176 RepID=A0A512ILQ6_9HYPH|nr:hypothetical protein [Methylobacterium haplocladii]GEO98649.1 hypothetical protein MHA02_10370 [Methylobacterium haplocladii]GJD83951.1 hypothetical protein HPGCJGGD_1826 [Methylobacterium haplocladii]GLS57701.1 hypothetical protein GCM10007887_03570 [Methylobacterium haplocladii]
MTVRETFHIELLGLDDGTPAIPVQQRISVRVSDLESATERALRVFARARAPQRSQTRAEAVRVIDGAGREVFRWSRFDEPGG